MPEALTTTDIVISCTGSPGYVLEARAVREAVAARPGRPLFLIDIAVPRDIDPAAGLIENVYLRDVDDLESVSAASRREKEQETHLAEQVVNEATGRFLEWYRKLEALPTVIALRDNAEAIREGELSKTLKRLNGKLTPEEVASIDAMTRAIVNKLLHGPTVYLKERPAEDSWQVAREIFRLDDAEPKGAAGS
jgi:glutamyl-tRNA reductase